MMKRFLISLAVYKMSICVTSPAQYEDEYDEYLVLALEEYEDGNTAVLAFYDNNDELDYYGDVSINLGEKLYSNHFYLSYDISNIMDVLVQNDIAEETGFTGISGFNEYALMRFTDEAFGNIDRIKDGDAPWDNMYRSLQNYVDSQQRMPIEDNLVKTNTEPTLEVQAL